ncbi:hypothetical protein [Terrimonas alba]|uniref:hypothetical protein n=1 Tax=Terrimonas alba TaxID=3349636 RepID=UPI0035F3C192
MSVTIQVRRNKTVTDIQSAFNKAYPFLKIDMYKPLGRGQFEGGRIRLGNSTLLETANILEEGDLLVFDSMTVGQFEKSFLEKFGVLVQVSRKSGAVWLETTMTDRWTLKQQNDHGRELSEPASTSLPTSDGDTQ